VNQLVGYLMQNFVSKTEKNMKKPWMLILGVALLAAGSLAMSARAQSNVVYAVEYNQSTNRFGTINLLNGNFTRIASIGSTLINDIAYCPTNGMLYGISNTTALVTFNQTNGVITKVANLSVTTIESLAFRPSDGALFGATSSKLYTINPANGTVTSVGSYGSPTNLGTTGQNIRFAQDGNLYVSNTSTNTDIYRINTTNGAATRMGQAVGFPYLMLQNASSNMYGVFINLGSASNATPELVTFNLGSFVNGGTNANGSTHQITVTLVGAGTNFPANFNFSGNVPQTITNLTVPVSATGPSNQTAVAGSNVVFSTVASGTGPYNYAWSKNGAAISGQTNSSLMLNNVTTNDAVTYSVIVGGAMGTVTNSATLTVNVPVTVTVPPVNQTTVVGNNVTFSVTATGTGLSYQWLFNGSVIGTSNSLTLNNVTTSQAGIYTVIVNGAVGSATNSATLTVTKAGATVTLGSLNQTYTGSAKPATATTTPMGLAVTFTYNGSATVPTNAGSYTVIGTINDANYAGSATNTLVIAQASGSITLGSLNQTYTGSAKPATATTTPSGLTVTFTYNGSATVPTNAGSYTVIGTINDANYTGSATNTMVIAQASGSITLGSLSQTYTGSAKSATATTAPTGLAVSFTYNGSATVPTNAGSYTVIGTINDANYTGSATNTMVIAQASGSIILGSLSQTYTGSAKPATATTTPTGLAVTFTYNGSATVPTNAGSYTVIGTINDANYQGSATNTLVISQASGSITLGSLSQTYTGSAKPATATTTPTGLTVTFTYNGSATVPTNAGSYTVIGTINDANYQGSATNTLVIATATLTYTANVASMTYGLAVPGLSGSVSGFVGTDNQGNATTGTLKFTPAATSSSSVGSYAINGSGLTANNGNYTFVQAAGNATALTINALPVDLTGARPYDGMTTAAAGILTVANKVGSDNVMVVSGSGTLAGANVGSEAITSFGSLALGGTAAGNYTLAGASGSVNITVSALALTATNLLALDKVYDGTTNATLDATNAGLAGVLNGDDVTLVTSNAVAYFADKNVDTNKPVTVTGLALGGAAAANYTLVDPTNVAADITAAGLTVSGVTAAAKVYDGTTNAPLNGTAILNGEVSGDDVSLVTNGVSAAFAGPNVGTGIAIVVSGYAITGADAGNYTLTQPSDLAADITAATLTITAAANTKTYDGTTSASATPTTSGLQGSDTVTGLAETYDTKNVGTGKTLSVSAYTVNDGNSGNNYTVSTVTSTAGVIGKTTLTITAAANTKTYDGITSASATPTTSGLQGSDSVTGLAETYDTKNAGTDKTLSVSAYTVNDGNDGNNYTVSTVASTAGVINPATLTITAAVNTKTYDGMTSASATPTTSGLQGSDSVTGLAETYDTKNAGTDKTLSVSAYTVNDGNSGNNYTVSTVASTAGVINKAVLTITAAANTKTYDCSTFALATPMVSGLQGSDSVSGLAETYDTKNTGTGKTLNVSAFTVNDGNAGGNYTVSSIANTAGVITPATLTVAADNKSKICGLPNPPLTASYNGFVGGDNTNVLSSPAVLSTTATTTSGAGKYPITVGGAAAANYTIQDVNGTLLVISAPQLAGAKVSVNGMDQFVVSYPTIAGQTYQLEYTTDLLSKWTPLGTPFAGTDGIVAVTNSMSAIPQCFFRVEVQ
jgi:hypothetical protein